ncbi:MAG: thiamine diphosphokinase [Candidatus Kapabacteria bacterium]|nr:thiamine diphosphokinase [Candidatus Kapabacteria bacterium]
MGALRSTMKHVLTDGQSLEAVIVLNGTLPDRSILESFSTLPFVAADGAANALFDAGVIPDLLVGDLDSVRPNVVEAVSIHGQVIEDPDQEYNDFEKALRVAAASLWKNILVLGIHGGELEHTLNNWSVLMRHGRSMRLVALDGGRIGVPVYDLFEYEAEADEVISIIPQPHARLTTSGLRWPLTDEVLQLGSREGARNRAIEQAVSVTIHEGSALIFVGSRLAR